MSNRWSPGCKCCDPPVNFPCCLPATGGFVDGLITVQESKIIHEDCGPPIARPYLPSLIVEVNGFIGTTPSPCTPNGSYVVPNAVNCAPFTISGYVGTTGACVWWDIFDFAVSTNCSSGFRKLMIGVRVETGRIRAELFASSSCSTGVGGSPAVFGLGAFELTFVSPNTLDMTGPVDIPWSTAGGANWDHSVPLTVSLA